MNTKIILQALNESEALKSVNKNAAKIYTNDTDKVKEEIIENKSKDGGKTTVKTTKKDRKIQFPYGKKPEVPSDNKVAKTSDQNVVKEGANCETCKECGKAVCECNSKDLKEEYDSGTWKKHQDAIENEIDAAKEDMDADAFADFCDGIINYCQNCTGDLEQF